MVKLQKASGKGSVYIRPAAVTAITPGGGEYAWCAVRCDGEWFEVEGLVDEVAGRLFPEEKRTPAESSSL